MDNSSSASAANEFWGLNVVAEAIEANANVVLRKADLSQIDDVSQLFAPRAEKLGPVALPPA